MKRWKRALALGGGVLLLALLAGGLWFWLAKPWIPPVELTEPGPGGERIVAPGMIANYYGGDADSPRSGILLLGGSEGGIGGAVDGWARALHKEDHAILVLGYYRLPGQPQKFALVPLEGFARALDWLKARPDVDPERIAVIGASKGAEAALLLATRRPDVRAVVAAMPSSHVWNGFDWSFAPVRTSSWSEGGKPVPYLPITGASWSGDIYGPAFAGAQAHPQARIAVERIAAPLLLVCGEADGLWPSCPMARAVQAARDKRADTPTMLLAYGDAGHLGFGLPVPPGRSPPAALAGLGGTVAGNAQARADGWPRVVQFLSDTLQPPTEEG